ncbi:aldehyde dehydrogenase [Brevibacillus fluminis]|uniref:Aldehyde dehydrogenase n=1 Tax=Brevibacillus fluminis TaxID=511487 RepID=A0A3M8DRX5_9BACL|nr:aldehyde dehydrogenase [Brevibacillus fluminis]RNB89727.1 aldehyde dehydrogenase [Brevibacillus fluminis]
MADYQELLGKQRSFFASGQTRDLAFRKESLKRLKREIVQQEEAIMAALHADLNKSPFEGYATEIGMVLAEITHTVKHLDQWARHKRVKTPITHFGSKGYIYAEPYGVALIIAPWNYPFNLALAPLIAALAAGNCAILKPSELAPHTAGMLAGLIRAVFPEEYVAVVEGGVEASTALLANRFDYIFFTGGVQVGKIVMKAAADFLTPVTLELGGKSPCIVHGDADLKLAAKRIVWGKCLNAGQTCVAPDYVLVERRAMPELIAQLKARLDMVYGSGAAESSTFPKIINRRHFERVAAYLQDGEVLYGGKTNEAALTIEPTLVGDVDWESPVMQDEIFGPILPILAYDRLDEAISCINSRPKPLALYLFSQSDAIADKVLAETSFGGGCLNDTMMHMATPYLPFGGVGESGMGGYHGEAGFALFSHQKSVLKQTTLFDLPFRYATTKDALKRIRLFLR